MKKLLKCVGYVLMIAGLALFLWYFALEQPSVSQKQAAARTERRALLEPGSFVFSQTLREDHEGLHRQRLEVIATQQNGYLRFMLLEKRPWGWFPGGSVYSLPEEDLTVALLPWSPQDANFLFLTCASEKKAHRVQGTLTIGHFCWEIDGELDPGGIYSQPLAGDDLDSFTLEQTLHDWLRLSEVKLAGPLKLPLSFNLTLYDQTGNVLAQSSRVYPAQ